MKLLLVLLIVILAGCATPDSPYQSNVNQNGPDVQPHSSSISSSKKTPSQIAANARPALVAVRGYTDGEEISAGTGFFVRADGVLATSLHVVAGASAITVETADGEVYDAVYALSIDERRDLILLQIPVASAKTLPIRDDRKVAVGDKVFVLGNPLGLTGTFSDGLLSARRLEEGVSYLQITAPISEGSSGGPVMGPKGEVIGIANAYYVDGQNVNIAVPARHISGLLQLSNEPVLFTSLADDLVPAEMRDVRARAAQTVELKNALTADVRAELEEKFGPYQQQVALRILAMSGIADESGWELTDHSMMDTLATDDADGMTVHLDSGRYMAIGACDDDCTDLDLIVLDGAGDLVVRDVERDAEAVVEFVVPARGTYTVGASMAACAAEDCVYMIQLFQ